MGEKAMRFLLFALLFASITLSAHGDALADAITEAESALTSDSESSSGSEITLQTSDSESSGSEITLQASESSSDSGLTQQEPSDAAVVSTILSKGEATKRTATNVVDLVTKQFARRPRKKEEPQKLGEAVNSVLSHNKLTEKIANILQ